MEHFKEPGVLIDQHRRTCHRSRLLFEPNAVFITKSTAKKLFGNENPVGQSIKWDNLRQLKVTAVTKDLPKNESLQFDVLQTGDRQYQLYEPFYCTV
ncbi:ABC transporter permease [Pedobacter hartonius]|uniref:ABC transporter permease n=1 Tax=Pedobacter hartonius TaxID=425514 RepID=UPI00373FDA67